MKHDTGFYFRNVFSFLKGSLNTRKEKVLNKLRSLPNIVIHESFITGSNTSFNIKEGLKELTILENVECRNFVNFYMHAKSSLKINKNVFFNNYCSINCLGNIEIGENSIFGESVKIYDHNHKHHFTDGRLITERNNFNIGHVNIGKDCWIGSNVTILKNVEIGDNVIIGADCLIYKSIPSNSIVKSKADVTINENHIDEV